MVRSKKLVSVVTGLALIGVTLTFFSPAEVHATPPASTQNVNVVNTPLPVQGNVNVGNFPVATTVNGEVSIGGTPTVNVGNMPAVSISGTPVVLARDGGQPQVVNGVCSSPVIVVGRAACKPYTVPAGKQLVVEMISYRLANDAFTAAPIDVLAGQDGGFSTTTIGFPNTYSFPTGTPSPAGGGVSIYSETRDVRIYLDEGQTLILQGDFSGANNYSQYFMFSGFLVDK